MPVAAQAASTLMVLPEAGQPTKHLRERSVQLSAQSHTHAARTQRARSTPLLSLAIAPLPSQRKHGVRAAAAADLLAPTKAAAEAKQTWTIGL